ncbi:MAG: hypothetical protein GQ575_03965, partial [Deltaproteobacteria bacterium]|nr:hypothetical protein [Deltaproteobacteria bacterium]
FSREEILACKGAGFSTATMGRRTLRSETAAIGAVAALAAMMTCKRLQSTASALLSGT